jgi:hypothetical protein
MATEAQINFDRPRTANEAVLAKALERATQELVVNSADACNWWQMDDFTHCLLTRVAEDDTQWLQLAAEANRALRLARAALYRHLLQDSARAERIARAYVAAWDETLGHHRRLEAEAWEYEGEPA